MPREITILAQTAFDLADLARAAEGIDGAAEVREIDEGAAIQVLDQAGQSLVTVYRARLVQTVGEIERLLPDAPNVALPVLWSDAVAPWGPLGEAGVSIALRLALRLEAVCLVAD
jgi:hypothetical protein